MSSLIRVSGRGFTAEINIQILFHITPSPKARSTERAHRLLRYLLSEGGRRLSSRFPDQVLLKSFRDLNLISLQTALASPRIYHNL